MKADKDYIFISYSRDDEPKVTPIVEEMKNSGYKVRYDDDIQPGEAWTDRIASLIENCTVCIALHSQTSRDSPHCREEIYYARDQNKTVIPVYLENVELEKGLKMRLSPFQAVRYTNDPAKFLKELRKSPEFRQCGPDPPPNSKVIDFLKGVGAWCKKKAQFVFKGLSCVGIVILLVVIIVLFWFYRNHTFIWTFGKGGWPFGEGGAAFVSHKNQTPLWFFDDGGVLDIISLPLSEDYSYELDKRYPPPWAGEREFIQCAVIRKGVTRIGASSFQDCRNMQFVFIPESVTSIGELAFSGCRKLETVSLPSGIDVIRQKTFSDCTALTQVWLSDGISQIGYEAFANCTSLERITIPNSVHFIWEGAFVGCPNLKEVHISYDRERVKIVERWEDWTSLILNITPDLDSLYIYATAFDFNPQNSGIIKYNPPIPNVDAWADITGNN